MLFKKLWDLKTCAGIIDKMAWQIFGEKQSSSLSCIFQIMLGDGLLLSRVHKWLSRLLYEGCYSGRVFDLALKEVEVWRCGDKHCEGNKVFYFRDLRKTADMTLFG